ncbi:MAG: hypothetical protein H6832_05855 [Planctomycetes bacterium]|nr:hypothetical protein [Planctomycetota bacterium]MCB9917909.1 hypothetical protein [Planctomycetota bacterium]
MANVLRAILRRSAQSILRRAHAIRGRRGSTRDVLFLCQNGLMSDYLAPVWELLKADERLRFFLTYPRDERIAHEVPKIQAALPVPVVRLGIAECRRFDLIVTADHGYEGLATRKNCPVLYTGHGMTGKVVEGEAGDYGYGPRAKLADGTPRYSVMLEASESNRVRVAERDPVLASAIRVVGSLHDDRLLAKLSERDRIRNESGYAASDRVVLVQSTWGPHCLFRTVGEQLLEQLARCTDTEFVLSVHPHEYRPTGDGTASWGARLTELDLPNVRVRDPKEPWIPSLVAADAVITDHTSLVIYAALAHKPTLWTDVPEQLVQEGTALARLRSMSPVWKPETPLGEALGKTIRDYPYDALTELASELNSCPGEAGERIRAVAYELLGFAPAASRSTSGPALKEPVATSR